MINKIVYLTFGPSYFLTLDLNLLCKYALIIIKNILLYSLLYRVGQ